jgi:hypothetical protein
MAWIRDRALTLVLMTMFLLFLAGQVLTGLHEYNDEQEEHGLSAVGVADYLATGHPWEALFENWESEFLLLTTCLLQKGSPESRRPNVTELVDIDPRGFADSPDVRRGGWVLLGGFATYAADHVAHRHPPPTFRDYVTSSRFWFESFQNWQSEFLAIASMVWLAVYLRQRWSPESKPVHAPHTDTGR